MPRRQLTGPVALSGNSGGLQLDAARVQGPVSLTGTVGGAEIGGNTISGPLTCSRETLDRLWQASHG